MPAHTALHNKADFDKAIATQGKYVFIYAYEGEISPKAEEYATKFASTTDAYSVNVNDEPTGKIKEYFKISEVPAAIVYKDGKELIKKEGINKGPAVMEEVGKILSS